MILKWYENTGFYWEKWRLIRLLFWIINRNFLKILIKFDRILIFQGFERIFESDFNDFIEFKSDKNVDFSRFYRTRYRTRKWVFMHGNNRYALFGNRTFVLKCKPRPPLPWKRYYNSTVLQHIFCVTCILYIFAS